MNFFNWVGNEITERGLRECQFTIWCWDCTRCNWEENHFITNLSNLFLSLFVVMNFDYKFLFKHGSLLIKLNVDLYGYASNTGRWNMHKNQWTQEMERKVVFRTRNKQAIICSGQPM